MATKLTIDEGNSSVKIALWRDDVMVQEVTCRHANLNDMAQVVAPWGHIDAAIYCSVCRHERSQLLDFMHLYADRAIILDAHTPMPITLGYRTPNTLGADRIAAAVGATVVAPKRTALVVDMGTAITYDVVTAEGEYLGGNIAPGIFVRLEALNHFTQALPLIETDGDCPRWGYDTTTAMRAGAIRGVVGELQYYRHCLRTDSYSATVVLTGGSADLIMPYISTPTIYEPNLVLIGLNRILNYNENN